MQFCDSLLLSAQIILSICISDLGLKLIEVTFDDEQQVQLIQNFLAKVSSHHWPLPVWILVSIWLDQQQSCGRSALFISSNAQIEQTFTRA